jgi:hypothetical protein
MNDAAPIGVANSDRHPCLDRQQNNRDTIGNTALIVGVVLIIGTIVFYYIQKKAARLAYLRAKCGSISTPESTDFDHTSAPQLAVPQAAGGPGILCKLDAIRRSSW